jgi:hypothetical protein
MKKRVLAAVIAACLLVVACGGPAVAGQVRDNWSDGWGALASLSSGSQNTGVGLNAFRSVTGEQNNTGLGYGAGRTSTGGGNTALGTAAMFDAGAGDLNVAVGLHAGRYITGSRNVLVGADTGTAPGVNNSVALGSDTVATRDSQVAVGARDVEISGGAGIVLTSPDGTRWLLTVNDDGSLSTALAD